MFNIFQCSFMFHTVLHQVTLSCNTLYNGISHLSSVISCHTVTCQVTLSCGTLFTGISQLSSVLPYCFMCHIVLRHVTLSYNILPNVTSYCIMSCYLRANHKFPVSLEVYHVLYCNTVLCHVTLSHVTSPHGTPQLCTAMSFKV